MKLEISKQTFEKYSTIKFHKNLSSVKRVVPCGQTDRHDKANNSFCAILRTLLETSTQITRRPVTHNYKIALQFLKSPWYLQKKYPWILSWNLTRTTRYVLFCCLESKWQTAGQDSHRRVTEVERGAFLLLNVGRNHWCEVRWRHFLLFQGNNVATSYARGRDISQNW